MTGTWELKHDAFNGWLLVMALENGHRVVFPLPADHPMVLGIRSASKMTREEPA